MMTAPDGSRDRHLQEGEGYLRLKLGHSHLNDLLAEARLCHAFRFRHDLRKRCLGGCASRTWLRLESRWMQQSDMQYSEHLCWQANNRQRMAQGLVYRYS